MAIIPRYLNFVIVKLNKIEERKLKMDTSLCSIYVLCNTGNVSHICAGAEIGAEFSLPRYNFLSLKNVSTHEKPALA